DSVKIGYEISFTRYFYQPKPMWTLAEVRADVLSLAKETEGLLDNILRRGSNERDTRQSQDRPRVAQGREILD
ncbi:MAG: hypothetical protein OXI33_06730, partial [Chloroflexota bacterium]|nr:hypothetical protein [Chloroflexota bacterium]